MQTTNRLHAEYMYILCKMFVYNTIFCLYNHSDSVFTADVMHKLCMRKTRVLRPWHQRYRLSCFFSNYPCKQKLSRPRWKLEMCIVWYLKNRYEKKNPNLPAWLCLSVCHHCRATVSSLFYHNWIQLCLIEISQHFPTKSLYWHFFSF